MIAKRHIAAILAVAVVAGVGFQYGAARISQSESASTRTAPADRRKQQSTFDWNALSELEGFSRPQRTTGRIPSALVGVWSTRRQAEQAQELPKSSPKYLVYSAPTLEARASDATDLDANEISGFMQPQGPLTVKGDKVTHVGGPLVDTTDQVLQKGYDVDSDEPEEYDLNDPAIVGEQNESPERRLARLVPPDALNLLIITENDHPFTAAASDKDVDEEQLFDAPEDGAPLVLPNELLEMATSKPLKVKFHECRSMTQDIISAAGASQRQLRVVVNTQTISITRICGQNAALLVTCKRSGEAVLTREPPAAKSDCRG